jgi:uncharacterized protein (TIGR02271 family)
MSTSTGNTTRVITGLFDGRAEAERAIEDLVQRVGIARERVRLHAAEGGGSAGAVADRRREDRGFWASLRDLFVQEEDAYTYSEAIRRGGFLVSAQVEEGQIERAMDALEACGAVDLTEREAEWRSQGWTGYAGPGAVVGPSSDGTRTGVVGTTAEGQGANAGAALGRGAAGQEEERIPLAEERLRVGKREAGHGRVRVRSYVVEAPVEEQVTLREERVDVERRPVDRPVADADRLFQERTVEAAERAEEAVVGKEARVREEVVVRKEADERVETVRDTVRRTEVEVDDERGRRAEGGAVNARTGGTADPSRSPGRGA